MNLDQYIDKTQHPNAIEWRNNGLEFVMSAWKNINRRTIPDWDIKDKELNNQMVFYLARDKRFTGDLNKGIMFIGNVGSGKTRMMQSLSLAMGFLHRFRFLIYSGNDIGKPDRDWET